MDAEVEQNTQGICDEDERVFYVIILPDGEDKLIIAKNFGQASQYARDTYGPKIQRATPEDVFDNIDNIEDIRGCE